MSRFVPLSFAQQRLWFIDQFEPGSSIYNVLNRVHLTGPLDRECLTRAVREIVDRHDVLRTRFVVSEGEPFQEILAEREIPVHFEDLSFFCERDRGRRLAEIDQEERSIGFDLARDPLIRLRLVRVSSEEHVLFDTMHHIISDGWSMEAFYRELSALYGAYLEGTPSPLEVLPAQYADYAEWQRSYLTGEVLERQLAYWREQLTGATSIELPFDRPASQALRHLNESLPLDIPGALVERLRAFSQLERASLFMVLLATFKILLYRYTGQGDLVVGTPMAGRTRPEFEKLIGFFINTLALRTQVSADLSFREVLQRVRMAVFGLIDHQEIPFDKIVMELHPERDPGRTPFISVVFNKYNATHKFTLAPGLEAERVLVAGETAKFDLTVIVRGSGDRYQFTIEYDTDLFDRETIEQLGRHYRHLLECILEAPDTAIGALPMLSGAETTSLLEWSGRATDYPHDLSIPELFVRQAAASPDVIAVEHGQEQITYRELETRADALAARLIAAGVRPGDRVGLQMDRSIDLVIGMLGTLKAGAAYVPLDASYPVERLRLMEEDAGLALVLTDARGPDAATNARPLRKVGAQDPAYVFYTSGSTGRPKGVVVPHRAIVRLAFNSHVVQVGPRDVVAHLSNPSFDASTFEIWSALLNGARISIFDRDDVLSPDRLLVLFDQRGITTTFLTTALFNLVARTTPGALANLRCVIFGGETADPELTRRVLRAGAPGQLVNAYGPTECTTFSTLFEIVDVPEGAISIPIGRPLDNTTAYVLDDRLQPVPIGVPGELFIGGDALALGYLNRPELTAERFVSDPFSACGRLYRTGDRVRWRRDGVLEFLGRFDDQVKIRGFRIEPGEIEAVLSSHPDVLQAVVLACDNDRQEKELVAYVVPGSMGAPPAQDLQHYLRDKLPDYMVPTAFVPMDAFPLTPNGKIDRRALPRPDRSEAQGTYAAPRSSLETELADLWSQVLGIERVGIHDNFFDLGAHSLLITVAASRIRDQLRREISVRVLFDYPSVAELAAYLSTQEATMVHEEEDDLEALLSDIEQLSEEEAERLLNG